MSFWTKLFGGKDEERGSTHKKPIDQKDKNKDSRSSKMDYEVDSVNDKQVLDSHNTPALLKLFEFGFDPSFSGNGDLSAWYGKLDRIEEFDEALNEIVGMGDVMVPSLIQDLDKSAYIARALSLIGSPEALEALKKELYVPNTARVQASVFALGETKNPEMIPVLREAVNSAFVNDHAELFPSFSDAEGKLNAARLGDRFFDVDRRAPVEQINSFMNKRHEYCKDEDTRAAVLNCLKQCGENLPQMEFTFGSRSSVNSKAWAYWRIAIVFYYYTYPDDSSFVSPCNDAYEWAKEAIRLDPSISDNTVEMAIKKWKP